MTDTSTIATRSKRSRSAEGVAVLRAIGHRESDPVRRNPDHLAVRLLSPAMRLRVEFPPLRALTLRMVQRLVPGGYPFITARTKHMDQIFLEQVHSGVRQVAILGAGADSRAYRFADDLAGGTVFELDHPITSQWKRRQVQRLFGRLPEHVRYVPIDLDRQPLDAALAGAVRSEPTLFLWEGVTPYLSRPAIDSTLATVAQYARGSSVVFDYVYPDDLDPRTAPASASRYQAYLRRHGEPVVSGLDPQTLGTVLTAQGLTLVSNLGPAELSNLHLGGTAETLPLTGIAHGQR